MIFYQGLIFISSFATCCSKQHFSVLSFSADILREFNPSLIGYSIGTGKETTDNAALNQAVAGDRAE